jgi:hypothetical protein
VKAEDLRFRGSPGLYQTCLWKFKKVIGLAKVIGELKALDSKRMTEAVIISEVLLRIKKGCFHGCLLFLPKQAFMALS